MSFKDEPDLNSDRKVKFQDYLILNDLKEYLIEISFTKTKLLIIACRRNHHYKCEFPIVQGKKIVITLGTSFKKLAERLRISSTKILYVENL